jgi:lipoprotein-anchoring transpeptidase ErfK/SrfK
VGAGRRSSRTLPVLLALLGLVALSGCNSAKQGTAAPGSTSASSSAPSSPAAPPTPKGDPVHVSLFEGDGSTYGVGMPIIVYFDTKVTDATAFDKFVQVTVNGQPANGAWYFEPPQRSEAALEAHYRLPQYWPAHAAIHLDMNLKDKSAGPGLYFDNDLTLDMNTGAAQVGTVDGSADTMTLTADGQPVRTLQVSLGAAKTPTYLGTKLVMAKSNPERMKSDPGDPEPYDVLVPWSVRVTNSGEFIHDASWNGQIGSANTSHGCTNLSPADSQWYYNWSQIGDPVTYTNTGTGQVVPEDDGWGDWNVDWPTWSQGGQLTNA